MTQKFYFYTKGQKICPHQDRCPSNHNQLLIENTINIYQQVIHPDDGILLPNLKHPTIDSVNNKTSFLFC